MKAIHAKQNALTLTDFTGKREYYWSVHAKGVEAFEKGIIELKQGDRMMWTRTDAAREQFAAQVMQVAGLNQKGIDVVVDDEQVTRDAIIVNMDDPHYWHIDHAYGITSRKGQGAQSQGVLWAIESSHPHLTTQKHALVSLTRGQQGVYVFTDDKKQLVNTLREQPGEKATAIEVSGRTDRVKAYIQTQQTEHGIVKPSEPIKSSVRAIQPTVEPAQRAPQFFDKNRIIDALNDRAEEIAESLLGPPKKSHGTRNAIWQ